MLIQQVNSAMCKKSEHTVCEMTSYKKRLFNLEESAVKQLYNTYKANLLGNVEKYMYM